MICIQIKPDLSICDSFKQRIKYIMIHKTNRLDMKTPPGVRTIERCTESMGIGYGTQRQYFSTWGSCFVHCCVSAVGLVFSLQLNSQPIPDKNGTAKHYFTVDCLGSPYCAPFFPFFLERLGQDGPREDSIEMLCLPLGCCNPGKGCRGNRSEWWGMVIKLT